MVVGFTNKEGDFVPTEKYLPVLHSSMLFPPKQDKMNDQKRSHLHDFAKKALFGSGKTYGVTASLTKSGINKINESRDESNRKKQDRINGINEAVSVIVEEPETSNIEKISQLQRLLNVSSKDMDNALLSRIRLELNNLHKANDKQKSKKKQSEPKQDKGVTFADMADDESSSEPSAPSYESDSKPDNNDDEKLSTQDLAVISSIQSQVS